MFIEIVESVEYYICHVEINHSRLTWLREKGIKFERVLEHATRVGESERECTRVRIVRFVRNTNAFYANMNTRAENETKPYTKSFGQRSRSVRRVTR